MNPPKFDRVDDIADLTFLNEASVVHNLRLRYGSGAIYTYSGLFLVAINPYQALPLYSDAIVHQYRGKRRDENPPHIFAIAERAWMSMGEERENQSILITGESGADAHPPSDAVSGHTQSPSLTHSNSFSSMMPTIGLPRNASFRRHGHTKTASVISTSSTLSLTSKMGRLGLLERQILQANPILEAFGNAQTQRNNNSSRFGKFIRISFAPDGSIAGANIDWYLLEKSRVVVRSEAERSFHVFYQLMEGGGSLKNTLLLDGGVEDYEYLNKSRREVDGIDDREEWALLKNALDVVGFTPEEQVDLFRVVAAILHIGNITVTATRSDDALMPDTTQAERACHLLGIQMSDFTKALLRPRVLAGREWVTQARTRQQAVDELAALCKTLYEKSFGRIVDRINRALDRPSSKSTFIGVLDIAGFEIFETNTYEQLLINYTNEKLQQFFNHHMFVLEQEEYAREGIEWDYVNFGLDLQPTIDLIETSGNAIGVLSLLDEECIMPKATDLTFTHKLHTLWATDGALTEDDHPGKSKYEPSRFDQGFIVHHYAGRVEYRTDGWLEKNKDPLNDNLTRVLAGSSEKYVASLFTEYVDTPGVVSGHVNAFSTGGKKRMTKKGAFRTVGQRHKEQLASLMGQLQATQPHFVRCIVPNTMKKPGRIDIPLVLDQLRCNGVLEGIRIARLGYPNRQPFVEFRQRYEILTPGVIPRGYMDGRKACLRMIDALELDKSMFKIGTSKIFFKAGVLAELEERRDALLFDVMSRLQAAVRMFTARRQMKKEYTASSEIGRANQVRPLLAATRNDEELRRKETELALAKERAERDKQEKEALEGLKMRLEADKRKVEEDLEAERALALDKDSLLERSKNREVELEEDIAALQSDLDTLDSQLDRALKLQKESEEKHETLRQAFDQAAEHLVRLEAEQQEWTKKEVELTESLNEAEEDIDILTAEKEELQKTTEELKNLVAQREEDVIRVKERMEANMADLDGKLSSELRNRDSLREKSESLEEEARHAKEQLAEMARTATEYSNMIKKKEENIDRLSSSLEASQGEHARLMKEIAELQGRADTLTSELHAQQDDRNRTSEAHAKLQEELDELRVLLQAKVTEETRRSEVEKSKEVEIADLRAQTSKLSQDLTEVRKQAAEGQNKLKVELDTLLREHRSLEQSHRSLTDRESSTQVRLKRAETSLSEAEKSKRTLESDLQSLRSRQIDLDSQLAATSKDKEALERKLITAQSKYQDFEDVVLQLERDKAANDRQTDALRKQLEAETSKRQQLEHSVTMQKTEIIRLKDLNIKLDRELNKALNDLKAREWEVKQLEAKQDKTIVEHVHVLEEAKRVTDRQLAEAQVELQKQEAYIRSLEKSKSRLAGEAEDLAREREREQVELRTKAKAVRAQEEKVTRALADVEKEKRAREAAELQARRFHSELQIAHTQVEDVSQQLATVQKAKDNLEDELTRLADEADAPSSVAKLQRQYEARINQLEYQLEEVDTANTTALRIKEHVDRQHQEIRRLILSGPKDEAFRTRILRELQLADEEMEREMLSRHQAIRPNTGSSATVRTMANVTPKKATNGIGRLRAELEPPRTPDKQGQVSALKREVQLLEIQMATSTRVRHHLEGLLREMTAELENSDGSQQSLERYRNRLAKENNRLAELLEDEAEARRATEAAQLQDVQTMWSKFQSTLLEERESYARLEESRKALFAQQRAANVESEDQRRQVQELSQAKKQLQSEIADLKDRLEMEIIAKNDETGAKRQLQMRLQELEITSSTSSTIHSELQEAVETYKTKTESYLRRLEEAEIAKAKAVRAEAFARRALADAEKTQAEVIAERQAIEERLSATEERMHDLEAKLEEEGRESSGLDILRQRLTEEMEDERKQHQQDLAERDFTADQTRKKYQTELAQLTEEMQSQRDTMSRIREENRKIRSEYDELQLRFDDEVYNGGAWKKEKERMETKIQDLIKAYESSTAAQSEQQSQIVALHSQVRELRGVLNDAEADRALLQKARRALQAELESIKMDSVDASKIAGDTELQRLRLQKQDLERAVEEQEDRVGMAFGRMKKAETYATECQVELGKVRVENSELDKLNANLERQIKELNVRIVDLETKSLNSPRPPTTSRRDSVRVHRTADRNVRDTMSQLAEADRQRTRLEEENRASEARLMSMRQDMDELQTSLNNLQLEKRRTEREAADYRQKALKCVFSLSELFVI
ncbi:hypothetical protein EW026_g1099 [Hermanssonia centrifuga]|uniref:Myosin motor domain-containing protein n=1 Tax=Hermanssonia centrifuga TaxID=98765 RepID=A0A4V3XBD1_9APHY|nr:hypothetical protein EW026_g1099 [Hermanssonia centrifuga]